MGTPSFYEIGADSNSLEFTDTINNKLSIRAYIDDKQIQLTKENKFYSSVLLGENYLSMAISIDSTTISLKTKDSTNNLQTFIKPGHFIRIGSEIMHVNSYELSSDGTEETAYLTVSRGQLNTTAVEHAVSDSIYIIAPRLKFASGSKGKRLKIVLEGQRGYVDSIGVIYKSKGVK